MSLKDITQPFPSLGMIKRSKLMDITPTDDGWEVQQPGHDAHKVTKEIHFYTCDCIGFKTHGMCSHVTAVRISQAPQDREDLLGQARGEV